jgi:hypothetical protein
MARPHIEFVQAQRLPWVEDALGAGRPGVAAKILSRDAATGAMSAILRYPAGYRRPAETLGVDEEIFVLDGRIETEFGDMGADCYGYWPRGLARQPVAAPDGAVALSFFSGPLALCRARRHPRGRVEGGPGRHGAAGDGVPRLDPASAQRSEHR